MGFRRCTPGNPRDLERHSGPNRGRGRQRCPTDQVLHRSVACAAGSPQNQRRERLVPRLCGRTLRGKTFGRSDETSSCAARRKRHAEVQYVWLRRHLADTVEPQHPVGPGVARNHGRLHGLSGAVCRQRRVAAARRLCRRILFHHDGMPLHEHAGKRLYERNHEENRPNARL